MHRFALLAIAFGLLVPLLASAPAQAQATRTWVSGTGDDSQPCSRTAPCKTFAGAISKTAPFGEINVTDPGGFGALTITKSITIRSDHIEAGVLVAGTNGIIVNLPNTTDRVLLEGLDFDGQNSGINGVNIIGKGTTTIVSCRISQFTGNGVNLAGGLNAAALIQDSVITYNGGGLSVAGSGGVTNGAVLIRSTIYNNSNFSLSVGSGSAAVLDQSALLGTGVAIVAPAGATVVSYGNNVIRGSGAPTSTVPLL
jgi:hypothetical protein